MRVDSHGKKEFEVEGILAHRQSNGQYSFKIKWKGYDDSKCTWQEEKDLAGATEMLLDYKAKNNLPHSVPVKGNPRSSRRNNGVSPSPGTSQQRAHRCTAVYSNKQSCATGDSSAPRKRPTDRISEVQRPPKMAKTEAPAAEEEAEDNAEDKYGILAGLRIKSFNRLIKENNRLLVNVTYEGPIPDGLNETETVPVSVVRESNDLGKITDFLEKKLLEVGAIFG